MKLNSLRLLIKEELKRALNEADWFDYLPDNPANQSDDDIKPGYKPKTSPFKILTDTGESAIFEKDGKLYYFYYDNIDRDDFEEYADVPREYVGNDEDGLPEFDYGDWEMDEEVVSNYLNDNYSKLGVGYGLDDYEEGKEFVEIDQPLKNELLTIFRDPNTKTALDKLR